MKLYFREGLDLLKPYAVDEAAWRIKVDANEMPDGFSPDIAEQVNKAMTKVALNRYPEIAAISLRQLLAADLGVEPQNVLVGNGSSELLGACCYAFGGRGRCIVYPSPSFSMYEVYARLADCEAVPVELTPEFQVPAEKVIEAAQKKAASLVILCNPNNPTGTVMSAADIEYIVRSLDCPVVVDEAYYEFFGESCLSLLPKYGNLIVARTFSKAYGLAAARVGYLVGGSEALAVIGKVLLPYHVNALSLAVAEAVYRQKTAVLAAVQRIVAERERMAQSLGAMDGITVYPSQTNFLLLKTDRTPELTAAFSRQGIGVRDFSKYPGLAGCIRITVGSERENRAVISTIANFFGQTAKEVGR
ncbi:MAG: histidinol-phosphate transaminase [Negativicutes bacterium]|nr:histidinol-phosphate transaminase [Negativicutes bacterium]